MFTFHKVPQCLLPPPFVQRCSQDQQKTFGCHVSLVTFKLESPQPLLVLWHCHLLLECSTWCPFPHDEVQVKQLGQENNHGDAICVWSYPIRRHVIMAGSHIEVPEVGHLVIRVSARSCEKGPFFLVISPGWAGGRLFLRPCDCASPKKDFHLNDFNNYWRSSYFILICCWRWCKGERKRIKEGYPVRSVWNCPCYFFICIMQGMNDADALYFPDCYTQSIWTKEASFPSVSPWRDLRSKYLSEVNSLQWLPRVWMRLLKCPLFALVAHTRQMRQNSFSLVAWWPFMF